MNKVLITVYVLSLEEEFDVFLPINLNSKEAIDHIQDAIYELSNKNYQKNDKALLYMSNGYVINDNNNVKHSGLTNGCKVALI